MLKQYFKSLLDRFEPLHTFWRPTWGKKYGNFYFVLLKYMALKSVNLKHLEQANISQNIEDEYLARSKAN